MIGNMTGTSPGVFFMLRPSTSVQSYGKHMEINEREWESCDFVASQSIEKNGNVRFNELDICLGPAS